MAAPGRGEDRPGTVDQRDVERAPASPRPASACERRAAGPASPPRSTVRRRARTAAPWQHSPPARAGQRCHPSRRARARATAARPPRDRPRAPCHRREQEDRLPKERCEAGDAQPRQSPARRAPAARRRRAERGEGVLDASVDPLRHRPRQHLVVLRQGTRGTARRQHGHRHEGDEHDQQPLRQQQIEAAPQGASLHRRTSSLCRVRPRPAGGDHP